MSRDTYYQFEKRKTAHILKDAECVTKLRAYAEKKKYRLGILGLTMEYARNEKEKINPKKVARIKNEYDIPTKIRQKKWKKPEQPKATPYMVIPENIVERKFDVKTPYCFAGTDVTYLWIPRLLRFAYLANVRDMASGEYLGFEVSFTNDQELADAAILEMVKKHGSAVLGNLTIHSDRGGTYTSEHFQKEVLESRKIRASMSRKGNCIDNAPTESGHGHLKDWLELGECMTLKDVRDEVARVIQYFNEERPQWKREKMTPVEYRNHLLGLAA